MKKFEDPTFHIVSLQDDDVIVTSGAGGCVDDECDEVESDARSRGNSFWD